MNQLLLVLIATVVLAIGAALADLRGLEARVPRSRVAHDLPAAAAAADPSADSGWRRTTRGWEHESAWQSNATNESLFHSISPIVIGVLQLCTAAGALAWFDKRS